MAVEKMMLVNLLGKMENFDRDVEALVNEDFHPEKTMAFLDDTSGYTSINEENPYTQKLQLLSDLSKANSPPIDIEHREVTPMEISEIESYIDDVGTQFSVLASQQKTLQDAIARDQLYISQLEHFKELDTRLDQVFSSEFIKVRFGRIPRDSYPKLQAYASNPYLIFIPCSTDNTHYWGVYFCPQDHADKIDRIFSHLYFERLRVPGVNGTPKEGIEKLQKAVKLNEKKLEEYRQKMKDLWQKERDQVEQIGAYLLHLSDIFNLKRCAAKHGGLYHVIGWIPAKRAKALKAHYDQLDDTQCIVDPPEDPDPIHPKAEANPPTRLKNSWLTKPFEMFVDMFGLPSYREIDPTGFVAITYAILFGIMFGDFGQGLLVIGVGAFMWKKMKMKLGPILMRVGIFSSLFGLIYGEVFGFEGVLDGVYENLLGVEPFKVMEGEHIIIILLSAVGLGVLMAIVSMILNIYSALRRRDFEAGLFGPSGVAGLVFYTSLIVGALLQMVLQIPVMNVAYILLLIVLPLFCIFFRGPLSDLISGKKNWMPEQIGGYIVENFFEMFEFLLSYFTNTLSFLRVGAFALVHAGMMMVVFTIAGLFGPIGYTITAIIGNVIVSALEGLLVGIQVLRLEYYEMFSRFYEGGGRPFRTVKNLRNVE
ncbi:V-type ATP synthase subunit I [Solibaculum mannosilyticum]|uniref:V-type ATP synthase subunit I n=1 Tax=Solibaculum mannosilyticum TaxID=2780922 RepID=UPI0007A909D9|nr:V-type ATP synthase subunit I [Eubacteriaceae bacterium CHKCI005]